MRAVPGGAAQERLLDFAEELLSTRGLQGLTVREMTQAAGVNVASINYVFGSKDWLLVGLLERQLVPMTRDRLERFDALAQTGNPAVPDLVSALIEPLVTMRERHGAPAVELFRYLVSHADEGVRRLAWDMLEPGARRFHELVVQALPERDPDLMARRIGLVCELAVPAALGVLDTFGLVDGDDDLSTLVDFIAGGLES